MRAGVLSWATIEKRLARLDAHRTPPPVPRSALALAADLGFTLDPWQRDVVTTDAREVLLLCSRQAGKSTTAAVLGLQTALYRPGSLVLIVAPSERQAGRLFRTLAQGYRRLGGAVAADSETKLSLELSNGSEAHALPGKEGTIRGFSGVDVLIVDEAARVPDDTYHAVRPMLAVSGGRLLALSTPFGKRGWFHDAWTAGGDGWHRVTVTAEQIPRIDPAWLAEERRRLPDRWFRQEYLCAFVETDDQVFGYDEVMAALSDAVTPLFGPGGVVS